MPPPIANSCDLNAQVFVVTFLFSFTGLLGNVIEIFKVMYVSPIIKMCKWTSDMFVKSMQISETEAIRTQIQPSKPKLEITKITNRQATKRIYGQPSEQLFSKRWPLSSTNRNKNFERT